MPHWPKSLSRWSRSFPGCSWCLWIYLWHVVRPGSTEITVSEAHTRFTSVAEMFDSRLIALDAEALERGADVVTTMTPFERLEEQVAAAQE